MPSFPTASFLNVMVRPLPLSSAHATVMLLAVFLVALAAQPSWPVFLVTHMLWPLGFWRVVLVPASLLLAAAVLAVNYVRPGSAWSAVRRNVTKVSSVAAVAAAVLIASLALAYGAGVLDIRFALMAILLFGFQVVVLPGSLVAALALAFAVIVLWFDSRGVRFWSLIVRFWPKRPRSIERAVAVVAPAVVTVACVGLLASSVVPSAFQGWSRSEPADVCRHCAQASFLYHSFNTGEFRLLEQSGFEQGKDGLTLAPGKSGQLIVQAERTPDSLVLLKAAFYNRLFEAPTHDQDRVVFQNAIEVSTDEGRSYRPALVNDSIGEITDVNTVDITRILGTSRTYRLRFTAENTTPHTATVLAYFMVNVVLDPLALPSRDFVFAAYGMATGIAVWMLLRCLTRRTWASMPVAVLGGVAVPLAAAFASWWAGARLPYLDVGLTAENQVSWLVALQAARLTAVVVVSLGAWAVWRGRSDGARMPWLALACLCVALIALEARWEHMIRVRFELLPPDARGYEAIAREFPVKMADYLSYIKRHASGILDEVGYDGRANALTVFYAGGNNGREPLWPTAIRLVFNVLGESAFHTRLTSLSIGVGIAVLTCWMGWRLLHPLVGVVAGLLLALSRPHITNNVLGLREELGTILLLGLVIVLFIKVSRQRSAGWGTVLAVGVLGAGIVLTRSEQMALVLALIATSAIVYRWAWQRWLVACAIMVALIAPMHVGYAFSHGDPFYPSTYGAMVNRNLEFPERHGTPGFPTREEFASNWAAGPKITISQYLFGLHTVPQFVEYSVRGFLKIFPTVLFEQQLQLLWLCAAGYGLLLLDRRWLVPYLTLLSLAPPYAFLAGTPNPLFAGRYAHHAYPWVMMATAYCALWLPLQISVRWSTFRQLLRSRTQPVLSSPPPASSPVL